MKEIRIYENRPLTIAKLFECDVNGRPDRCLRATAARCQSGDVYDFEYGAKKAFERLFEDPTAASIRGLGPIVMPQKCVFARPPQYKVGDKVLIVSKFEPRCWATTEMEKWQGQIVTLSKESYTQTFNIQEQGENEMLWNWNVYCFQGVFLGLEPFIVEHRKAEIGEYVLCLQTHPGNRVELGGVYEVLANCIAGSSQYVRLHEKPVVSGKCAAVTGRYADRPISGNLGMIHPEACCVLTPRSHMKAQSSAQTARPAKSKCIYKFVDRKPQAGDRILITAPHGNRCMEDWNLCAYDKGDVLTVVEVFEDHLRASLKPGANSNINRPYNVVNLDEFKILDTQKIDVRLVMASAPKLEPALRACQTKTYNLDQYTFEDRKAEIGELIILKEGVYSFTRKGTILPVEAVESGGMVWVKGCDHPQVKSDDQNSMGRSWNYLRSMYDVLVPKMVEEHRQGRVGEKIKVTLSAILGTWGDYKKGDTGVITEVRENSIVIGQPTRGGGRWVLSQEEYVVLTPATK